MKTIIRSFEILLSITMGVQWIFSMTLFFLGDTYLRWCEFGTYSPQKTG